MKVAITETLASIDAPAVGERNGFVAGIVLHDDIVIVAADIIKYMRGWSRRNVREYCEKRGWDIILVHEQETEKPDAH